MKVSAHTPGPWNYDTILKILRVGGDAYADHSDDVANARLIAAAPDLFKALANLVANEDGAESVKAISFAEARAAIAKARGVAPDYDRIYDIRYLEHVADAIIAIARRRGRASELCHLH